MTTRSESSFSAATNSTHTGTATVVGPTGTSPDIGDLGADEHGLNLSHGASVVAGRNNRQDIGISFDRPVAGLSFTITEVDSSRGAWFDRVELTGSPNFSVQTFTQWEWNGVFFSDFTFSSKSC